MRSYLKMLDHILENGEWVDNRTGIRTKKVTGIMFEHSMRDGFPLLTTKQMYPKAGMVELEGFINGITDKQWYQERGCHFWDDWCNPKKVKYGHGEETKAKMKDENDLGPIYGYQWINFNGEYVATDKRYPGTDQLESIIDTLKTNPLDRRMICSAWNPAQLHQMALPPCHLMFQCLCNGKELDLIWYQRSCDMFLGVPYNIMSYALLLKLISDTTNKIPRKLIGVLADAHIYENHLDQVQEQLSRTPLPLPTLHTHVRNIFDWTHKDISIADYNHHEQIKAPIAV